jgi:hypothetical protein
MACLDSLPQLTEAFTPEEIDIATRLEPFLPDLMPAVGLPYDGLEVLALALYNNLSTLSPVILTHILVDSSAGRKRGNSVWS